MWPPWDIREYTEVGMWSGADFYSQGWEQHSTQNRSFQNEKLLRCRRQRVVVVAPGGVWCVAIVSQRTSPSPTGPPPPLTPSPGACCWWPYSWSQAERRPRYKEPQRQTDIMGCQREPRPWLPEPSDLISLPLTLSFCRIFPGIWVNKLLCCFGQLGLASCYLLPESSDEYK